MNPTRLLLVVLAFFAALVSANKDFLIFDPANITIENAMAYTTFKVKLAYAINGTATVNFQANGISLSVCSLSFNATDYSVFKSVKILPNPSLNDSGNTNININAQICAADDPSGFCNHNFVPGVTCKATGDPHYTPAIGGEFDFQGEGDYYLLKSDLLSVQSHQYKCAQNSKNQWVTCSSGLAIRYGNSGIIFSLSNVTKDEITWSKLSTDVSPNEIQMPNATQNTGRSFELKFGDRSTLTIDAYIWKNVYHMDYKFHIASTAPYSKMGGLCNVNGNAAGSKKFLLADGAFSSNSTVFGFSWSVPDADNMFKGKYIVPTGLASPESSLNQQHCVLTPAACPLPPVTITSTVDHTSTTTVSKTTTSVVTTTSVSVLITTSVSTKTTLTTATITDIVNSTTTKLSTVTSVITATVSQNITITSTYTPSPTTSSSSSSSSTVLPTSSTTTNTINTPSPSPCVNLTNLPVYVPLDSPLHTSTTSSSTSTPTVCNMMCVLSCKNNPGMCAAGETCAKANPLDTSCCPVYKCVASSSTTASTTTTTTSTYSPIQTDTCEINYSDAYYHCTAAIPDDSCGQVLNRTQYLHSCAQDYSLSGAPIFIESHKQTYYSHCRANTGLMQKSPKSDVRDFAQTIRQTCGLGHENSCRNNCSGSNGVCAANGCQCIHGFSGDKCSISLYPLPVAKNTELITTADNKAVSADKLTKDGEADSKNNDKSASSASTLSTATSMITVLVVMIAAVYSF